jgi:hypothetical protein
MMPSRTKAVATLGASLVACLITLRLIGWRMTPIAPWSDMMAYSLPKYRWAADRIASGHLPLWNPLEFGGIPFLATMQPGVFYPPLRVLYALVHTDTAYDLLFLLHILVGAFSTLALMRSWGASLWASVLASLWVVNPGWLIRIFDHSQLFTTAALMPLLLWALVRTVRDPNLRSTGVLAATAACFVTAGYPPAALAAVYVASIAFACLVGRDLADGETRRAGRAAVAVFIAVCLGVLVTAIQTFPTIELAARTARSTEAAGAHQQVLDEPLLRFLGSSPRSASSVFHRLWDEYGPLPLLLALAAITSRPRTPPVWFSIALFTLAGLMPFQVLTHLPMYGYVRYAVEWSCLTSLSVFLIAGFGLDAATVRLPRLARFAPLITMLCVASVLTLSWRNMNAMHLPLPEGVPTMPAHLSERCGLARETGGRLFWPDAQRRGVLLHAGIGSPGGYESSLLPLRNAVLVEFLGIGNGIVGQTWVARVARERRLLARLGVTCVITRAPAPELEQAGFLPLPDREELAILYRVPSPTPRARLVFSARIAESPTQALSLVAADGDPRREVILESELAAPLRGCSRAGDARVDILRYAEEEVQLRVAAPCRGVLVLADNFYPGWEAAIDGSPASILQADYVFRGLAIESGQHDVVFRYRPKPFAFGAWLSLLGFVLIGTALVLPARLDPTRHVPLP